MVKKFIFAFAGLPVVGAALSLVGCLSSGRWVDEDVRNVTNPLTPEVVPIRAVAHRGLWDDKVAENTVAAIRRAYEAGAACVETDFNLEPDGQIRCYHDLKRVEWVKANYPDYRMPTLEEVLALVPKDREIQAEIKTYGADYADKFVKAVAAAGLAPSNVTVSSFLYDELRDFKAKHPEFAALWLVKLSEKGSVAELIAKAKAARFDVLCPGCDTTFGTISPRDADAVKAAGLDFRVYGVNTPSQFRRAVQLGATGFTSDRWPEARVWADAKMPRRGYCAHRGDNSHAPENTPAAMQLAIAKGAAMVEFDLQRCATGEIVVMHDLRIDRTTTGKGVVPELTFDEIRAADVGVKSGERFRGMKVPTLDEMLAVIPKTDVWINFHCYYADNRCIAEEVAEKLTKEGRLHQGVIAALEPHIAEARAKWPDVITCDMSRPGGYAPGWPSERIRAYVDTSVSNRCDSLQFFRSGTADDFEYAQRYGLTVNYFDADNPTVCAKLFSEGVDFILTNDLDAQRNRAGRLRFSDEFNGPLDTNVWTRLGPGKSGDWCKHMSLAPDLVEMRDGCMVLVGRANTDTNADPRPFLTGGVWNKPADERTMMTYGLVEIRAKFEDATGAWPAFWMLARDRDAEGRSWPWTGEIDIIERLNADPFVYQTAHTAWTYKKGRGGAPKQGGRAPIRPGEFNVYGLRRTPAALIWYVNGEETFRYEKTACGDASQWPFTTPFYFLLDMQLGGKWVGEVDATTLPVRTWIDWIRVYDDAADPNPPRKFVAAEQRSGTIGVYYDYPGRTPALQWQWSAKGDPNVREKDRGLFGVPDECKLCEGGRTIIMNDSLGGAAGLDVMSGLCRWYVNAGGNPHSVDMLPDGRVAVASSTGATLKIFDVKDHPFEPEKQKVVMALDLEGGHGVVWDAARNSLFALGYHRLYELDYSPATMSVKVRNCWSYAKTCGDAWGHDLLPDGGNGYYFTNHTGVWHFNPETGRFTLARTFKSVKAFSPSPSGDLVTIPRESWWTDTLLVLPHGSSDIKSAREITVPGAKFYKARYL